MWKTRLFVAFLILLGVSGAFLSRPVALAAPPRQAATPTLPPLRIEVYNEDVNVRAGPGTNYDLVGRMIKGQWGEIIGRSPDSRWLKIIYIGGPDNSGWVFKDLVRVVGDIPPMPTLLPPPTPTVPPTPLPEVALPEGTATLDPNSNRPPTFTPPAAVVRPTLLPASGAANSRGFPPAILLISLFVLGSFGMAINLLSRR